MFKRRISRADSHATGHKTLRSAVTYNTQFSREICGQAAPVRQRGGVVLPAPPRCAVTAGNLARGGQGEPLSPARLRCAVTAAISPALAKLSGFPARTWSAVAAATAPALADWSGCPRPDAMCGDDRDRLWPCEVEWLTPCGHGVR
jgi:hypothetical protein